MIKFAWKVKTLLETELLEDDSLRQLEVILSQLEEKCTLLKMLDESILATNEIENEIVEAEEVTDKIIQLRMECLTYNKYRRKDQGSGR